MGSVVIEDSDFIGNQATDGDGGAVFVFDGSLVIRRSEIRSSSASEDGGAIYIVGAVGGVVETTFIGNEAGGRGGSINLEPNSSFTVSQSVFRDSTAASAGGAIAISSVIPIDSQGRLRVVESSFVGNQAATGGGAITVEGETEAEIEGSFFLENSAENGGAIRRSSRSTLNVSQSVFRSSIASVD